MGTFNFLFLSSVFLLFSVPEIFGAAPWEPEIRTDEWGVWRHEQNKQLSAENAANINIIFYGDSITEGWLVKDWANSTGNGYEIWQNLYKVRGAVNYGIGNDRTQNLLYQIADGEVLGVQGLNPKVVVLKIGTNNGQDSTDDVVRGIKAVVDSIREKLPNTKVLLLGILPRSDANWFSRVVDINIKISQFDDGQNIRFLDMFEHFIVEWGVVKPELFEQDKLHLLTPGYETWSQVMEPLLSEMLAS